MKETPIANSLMLWRPKFTLSYCRSRCEKHCYAVNHKANAMLTIWIAILFCFDHPPNQQNQIHHDDANGFLAETRFPISGGKYYCLTRSLHGGKS